MSNRVALAPIKDTALNVSSPLKHAKATLLPSRWKTTPSYTTVSQLGSEPEAVVASQLTSLMTDETQSEPVPALNKTQAETSVDHSALLLTKHQESPVRLAALQLRIKLRLAIHKLQHSRNSRTPIVLQKSATRLSPAKRNTYSANVNLSLHRVPATSNASLVSTSESQIKKRASLQRSLRLFKVKSLLAAHILSPVQLPLTRAHEAASRQASLLRQNLVSALSSTRSLGKSSFASHAHQNNPGHSSHASFRSSSSTNVFRGSVYRDHSDSDTNMRYAIPLASITSATRAQPYQSLSLPSINKILHTPMKATSARSLYMLEHRANQSQSGSVAKLGQGSSMTTKRVRGSQETGAAIREQCLPNATTNIDDTIDESQMSFSNTLDVTPAPKRRQFRGNDQCHNLTVDNHSSSPLHLFGTPSSFSVAKSLLQLSGHGV